MSPREISTLENLITMFYEQTTVTQFGYPISQLMDKSGVAIKLVNPVTGNSLVRSHLCSANAVAIRYVKRIPSCKFYPYVNILSMRNNKILILKFLKLISRTNNSYSYVNNSRINNHPYIKRIPS